MSVHRFLTNIDVLYAVFAHLDLFPIPLTATDLGSDRLATVEGDSALIRRTLANAALTCRAFSGPASKTLWTCLHLHVGLWPLLKLFEQDVAMGGNQFYQFDGEIPVAAWERFDRLASRVRYLDLILHPHTAGAKLDALIKRCQTNGRALLPNLQILRWPESLRDPHRLQLLRALSASPSLSLVSISHSTKAMARDLAVITETHPDLPHFISAHTHQCLQLHSPILSLRFLRSLHIDQVDRPSFCQIGTFPYLTDLWTSVSRIRTVDSSRVLEGAFPALRRFRTCCSSAILIWTITQISSPNLTSLPVGMHTKHIQHTLPALETLFALPAVRLLRQLDLSICFESVGDGSVERTGIAFSDIAHPILSLHCLEDVRLHVLWRTLSLSDADIVLIKSAWPCLSRLSLSFDAREPVQDAWGPIPRPSLLALVDLALARPQLETLDVEVASITEEDHPTRDHLHLHWCTWTRTPDGVQVGVVDVGAE